MSASKLTQLLQPVVEDLGFEFVGLEYSSNPKNPALVIYIDRTDGIDVDHCEQVSREVAAVLDVTDPIPGNYTLQVSSPGLDRPLFTPAQFARFVGEEVQVNVFAPVGGRRRFKAEIEGVDGDQVTLLQDGKPVVLDAANIAKARLVPDYDRVFAQANANEK